MKKIIIWLPRIITALFSLFLATFALDAFSGQGTFGQHLAHFIIHLIPAGMAVGVLVVAWRYRILGGLLAVVVGLIFAIYFHTERSFSNFMMLSFPMLLSGLLFIFSYWNADKRPF